MERKVKIFLVYFIGVLVLWIGMSISYAKAHELEGKIVIVQTDNVDELIELLEDHNSPKQLPIRKVRHSYEPVSILPTPMPVFTPPENMDGWELMGLRK